jgi:hypothetical protein
MRIEEPRALRRSQRNGRFEKLAQCRSRIGRHEISLLAVKPAGYVIPASDVWGRLIRGRPGQAGRELDATCAGIAG